MPRTRPRHPAPPAPPSRRGLADQIAFLRFLRRESANPAFTHNDMQPSESWAPLTSAPKPNIHVLFLIYHSERLHVKAIIARFLVGKSALFQTLCTPLVASHG